jgi:hypothetical protein
MKDRVILFAIIIAILSLLIGLLGKIIGTNIIFANRTWHMFAQTALLFAIAWGVWRLLPAEKRE